MTVARDLPPCPACSSSSAIPIAYGYPTSETFEAADRGEVVLGGCLVGPESPDFECRTCHAALPWVRDGEAGTEPDEDDGIELMTLRML